MSEGQLRQPLRLNRTPRKAKTAGTVQEKRRVGGHREKDPLEAVHAFEVVLPQKGPKPGRDPRGTCNREGRTSPKVRLGR